MSFEGDDNGDDGRPVNKVTRRTLLQGASLFSGLGAWHTAVTAGSLGVAGALLSVPGQAVAQITGCIAAYTHNGHPQDCSPTYFGCSGNTGHTHCFVQSGGTVACNSDDCNTMSANNYNCGNAECNVTFEGNCLGLDLCHNQTGNCTALMDCDAQIGDCGGLTICNNLEGKCNSLDDCDVHDGECPGNENCDCHNGAGQSSLAPKHRLLLERAAIGRMPYAKSLGSEDE